MPEVIHDSTDQQELGIHGVEGCPAYQGEAGVYGDICCYADDTTLSISSDDPATLSARLTAQYKVVAQFMVDNRLKLNDDKTHLLVMGTGNENTRARVKIITPTEVITPQSLKSFWVVGCIKI